MKKNKNIQVIRIISMFLILVCHCLSEGGKSLSFLG